MRHSIALKIFAAVLGLFVLVFLVQTLIVSRSFNEMYLGSVRASQQQALSDHIQNYAGFEDTADSALHQHALETGSPVLVITEDHKIPDRDFMNRLEIVTVRMTDGAVVKIPVAGMEFEGRLARGIWVRLWAAQLGNSGYCEPMIVSFGGRSYTNAQSTKKYKVNNSAVREISGFGVVQNVQYSLSDTDGAEFMAGLVYERIKDCVIERLPVESCLEELSRQSFSDSGQDYRIYWESRTIEGVRHFFVTARRIVITGEEKGFINRFFTVVYLFLGLILIAAAYLLSRYISKPLIALTDVTEKIAGLDFSAASQWRSRDELGRLSVNIDRMSRSLQAALSDLEKTNAELEQASEAARANEHRMRELLADLAHEFKTPLSIISSHAEALEAGISAAHTDRFYGVIHREIGKLSDMVNEVIELSNLQTGNWRIRIEPWDLRDIITAVLDKFGEQLREEGFALTTDLADATVMMDARRIEQVLCNFLSNAMKYTGPDRHIEVGSRQEGPDAVRVYVGNSGSMSEQERTRIWQRYYTAGSPPRARLPSEGIGLDIVRSILEAHGSEHGVEQRDGMVFFYFILPTA